MIRKTILDQLDAISDSYDDQDRVAELERAWQDGFEAGSQDQDALDIAEESGYDEGYEFGHANGYREACNELIADLETILKNVRKRSE